MARSQYQHSTQGVEEYKKGKQQIIVLSNNFFFSWTFDPFTLLSPTNLRLHRIVYRRLTNSHDGALFRDVYSIWVILNHFKASNRREYCVPLSFVLFSNSLTCKLPPKWCTMMQHRDFLLDTSLVGNIPSISFIPCG